MKWYAEARNIFGKFTAATYAEFPPDRTSEGIQKQYRVRVEIKPEHEDLSLPELVEIYGTKIGCG